MTPSLPLVKIGVPIHVVPEAGQLVNGMFPRDIDNMVANGVQLGGDVAEEVVWVGDVGGLGLGWVYSETCHFFYLVMQTD